MFLRYLAIFALLALASNAADQSKAVEVLTRDNFSTLLNAGNFNQKIHGGRQEFGLVFFCAFNSAFCQRYSLITIEAIFYAKNWTSVLKFFTVDCGNDANIALCKEHGFKRAPFFKFFKPQTYSGYMGERVDAYINATTLLRKTVDLINRDYAEGKCSTCPNLKILPATISNPQKLWDLKEHYCVPEIRLIPVRSENDPRGITRLIDERSRVAQSTPVWRVLTSHPIIRGDASSGEFSTRILKTSPENCKKFGIASTEISQTTETRSDPMSQMLADQRGPGYRRGK